MGYNYKCMCLQSFTRKQQFPMSNLQFSFVERPQKMLWNEFIEAFLQSKELGLNASHKPPLNVQSTPHINKSYLIYTVSQKNIPTFSTVT